MMASRVTLLLLAIGLFAGMWSTDQTGERTEAKPLLARNAPASRIAQNPSGRSARVGVRETSVSRGSMDGMSIPLPAGIATGTYLIVDELGRTQTRTVTARDAFPSGVVQDHVAAEQYTARDGRRRWHFIRLDVPAELSTMRAAHSARATSLR